MIYLTSLTFVKFSADNSKPLHFQMLNKWLKRFSFIQVLKPCKFDDSIKIESLKSCQRFIRHNLNFKIRISNLSNKIQNINSCARHIIPDVSQ